MPLGYTVSHWGMVVKLTLWGWKAPQAITKVFSLGTLPEWARPKTPISIPSSSSNPRVCLIVETDGQARLSMGGEDSIPAGTTLFWTFTYLA